ncbi:SGNH/GDSL hydrolase family protein [Galbibacter mesophilus]|uniref:SGNH/GDSL hydrolase family protein n=1 Tax=Galbibacter mesophilus TaxID=379069 RepID=UPI00191EA561|nr:G-D-S-L family lipolytic protein [Galbibacter mesophilus]MCM5664316.1 G-D-S-L family lipolytic protein [Galbibacter mesophilus]
MKKLLYISIAAAATLTACQPEFNDPVNEQGFYTSGEADFSNFVAVGNSLTAGYADGALYLYGQQNSFPSILASQFSLVGGGEFNQPLVNDNTGGLLANGNQIAENRRVIQVSETGETNPVVLAATPTTDITNVAEGPFNNMGVPGAKSFHLGAPGYGNIANLQAGTANPYFIRMASSPEATVIADAVAQNPTFFSLWIGNNDILGYATSGGVGTNQTGNLDPTTYGSNDITDPNVFAKTYSDLLGALTQNDAKGVVCNIPNVTTIPYFTTVPHNPVPLDQATVNQLNQELIGPLKQILTAFGAGDRVVLLSATAPNPVMIKDENLTNLEAQLNAALIANGIPPQQAALMASLYGQARHATAEDLVTLPTSSLIGTTQEGIPAPFNTVAVTYPLEDANVLTPSEQTEVLTAQTAYNTTIKALADQNGLAFVDVETLMNQLASGGISFDGGTITNTYATGGAFSLDGVHPTARGYAVIANAIIASINETYGAEVPEVNPGAYTTIFVE